MEVSEGKRYGFVVLFELSLLDAVCEVARRRVLVLPLVGHCAGPSIELVNVQAHCVDCAGNVCHQVAGWYANKHEVLRIGDTRD